MTKQEKKRRKALIDERYKERIFQPGYEDSRIRKNGLGNPVVDREAQIIDERQRRQRDLEDIENRHRLQLLRDLEINELRRRRRL